MLIIDNDTDESQSENILRANKYKEKNMFLNDDFTKSKLITDVMNIE